MTRPEGVLASFGWFVDIDDVAMMIKQREIYKHGMAFSAAAKFRKLHEGAAFPIPHLTRLVSFRILC